MRITSKLFFSVFALCAVALLPPPAAGDSGCGHSKDGGWVQKLRGKVSGKKCHHGKRAHAFWWRSGDVVEKLRLDEGQVSRLDSVEKAYRQKITDAYEKAYEAEGDLHSVMKSPSSTAAQIRAAADKKNRAWMNKKSIKLDMLLEMRETLTPDQREELAIMKKGKRGSCGHKGKKH